MQQEKKHQSSNGLIIRSTTHIADPGHRFIKVDLLLMEDIICDWITDGRLLVSTAEDGELEGEILTPAFEAYTSSRYYATEHLIFSRKEDYLDVRLPSGRLLRFANPFFDEEWFGMPVMVYRASDPGREKDLYGAVSAKAMTSVIVEAITRDIINALIHNALVILDAQIVKLSQNSFVFQVSHDASIDDIKNVLETQPQWANGLSLSVQLSESSSLSEVE